MKGFVKGSTRLRYREQVRTDRLTSCSAVLCGVFGSTLAAAMLLAVRSGLPR